ILDPDKEISKRQYRMIKAICSNELFIRAESAARQVTGWDLLDLNQVEAHELIQYLDQYDTRDEEIPFEELDRELGMALDRFDPQKALLDPGTRLLCLLAMHRVATLGQVTRFLFGLASHTQSWDCKLAEQVLERALKAAIVARERGVSLRVAG